MKEQFFKCACGIEGILVEKKDCDEVCIALFSYGQKGYGRMTFKSILHHIFKMLKDGQIYSDMVILSQEKAEELGKFLLEKE